MSVTIFVAFVGGLAPLAAQDVSPADSPCASSPAGPVAAPIPPRTQPGQTSRDSAPAVSAASDAPAPPASPADCSEPAPSPRTLTDLSPHSSSSLSSASSSPYFSSYFSAAGLAETALPQNTVAENFTATTSSRPLTLSKTGKWGGEQWEPAILQALAFTWAQNGYRYVTEEKTRQAIDRETWHRYWLAVTGLHTWSDGGKTWTVYVAHPAQGAVFSDIWTEHDPHGALVPFGMSHAYWMSRAKAFWWNAAWELQWKFGPFSEASIGNVGLIPGKLGANTIVSTVTIGTGVAIGEDVLDRYGIAKWERHTDNRAARGFLRVFLNPDRSLANVFRKKYPWYRDRRPTLRDLDPE